MSTSLTRSYWGHAFSCVHKDIRNVDKVTVPGGPIDWQWFCGHFGRQARFQVAKWSSSASQSRSGRGVTIDAEHCHATLLGPDPELTTTARVHPPLKGCARDACEKDMVSPRTPTSSNSSALFESDDTFLEALARVVLPGDLITEESKVEETVDPSTTSSAPNETSSSSLEPPPCAQPAWNARGDENDTRRVGSSSNAQLPLKHSHLGQGDEPSLPQLESPTPAQSRYKKRAYSVSSDDEHSALDRSPVHSPDRGTSSYLDSDTYGASRFGGFGEYMRRKRAKLQIQNTEMGDTPAVIDLTSKLFSGLSIHVGQPALCH